MAAGKAVGGVSTDRRIARGLKIVMLVVVSLALLGACVAATVGNSGDNSLRVPPPTEAERADTVTVLTRAADAHEVCYGWQLREGSNRRVVSEGSNLGDGVPVDSDPARCPRWLQVVSDVTYTSESSELNDYAYVRVVVSSGLSTRVTTAGLQRFGITDGTFIDDPGWAITRSAVFLPLLYAEGGDVPPVPTPTAEPTAVPAALPAAGSDLWRDRWGYLIGGAVLLLVTVLLFAIGWFERRHQRRHQHHDRAPAVGPVPWPTSVRR